MLVDRNSVGLWIDAHHSTSENCCGSWFKLSEFGLNHFEVIYIFVTGSQSEQNSLPSGLWLSLINGPSAVRTWTLLQLWPLMMSRRAQFRCFNLQAAGVVACAGRSYDYNLRLEVPQFILFLVNSGSVLYTHIAKSCAQTCWKILAFQQIK